MFPAKTISLANKNCLESVTLVGSTEKTGAGLKTHPRDKPRCVTTSPKNSVDGNNFVVLEALSKEIQVLEAKLVSLEKGIANLLEEDKRLLKTLENREKLLEDLEKRVLRRSGLI